MVDAETGPVVLVAEVVGDLEGEGVGERGDCEEGLEGGGLGESHRCVSLDWEDMREK